MILIQATKSVDKYLLVQYYSCSKFEFKMLFSVVLLSHFLNITVLLSCEQVICCLEGARIGIQYETSFAGNLKCSSYNLVPI